MRGICNNEEAPGHRGLKVSSDNYVFVKSTGALVGNHGNGSRRGRRTRLGGRRVSVY